MPFPDRCFPHCVNIAVQTVVDELQTNPVDPILNTAASEADVPHLTRYASALNADPIGKSRDLVTTCRSSGGRRKELQTIIAHGHATGSWMQEEGHEIPSVQLLRDCKTRWSSTFLLIDRMLLLYPVRYQYYIHEPLFLSHVAALRASALTGCQEVHRDPPYTLSCHSSPASSR